MSLEEVQEKVGSVYTDLMERITVSSIIEAEKVIKTYKVANATEQDMEVLKTMLDNDIAILKNPVYGNDYITGEPYITAKHPKYPEDGDGQPLPYPIFPESDNPDKEIRDVLALELKRNIPEMEVKEIDGYLWCEWDTKTTNPEKYKAALARVNSISMFEMEFQQFEPDEDSQAPIIRGFVTNHPDRVEKMKEFLKKEKVSVDSEGTIKYAGETIQEVLFKTLEEVKSMNTAYFLQSLPLKPQIQLTAVTLAVTLIHITAHLAGYIGPSWLIMTNSACIAAAASLIHSTLFIRGIRHKNKADYKFENMQKYHDSKIRMISHKSKGIIGMAVVMTIAIICFPTEGYSTLGQIAKCLTGLQIAYLCIVPSMYLDAKCRLIVAERTEALSNTKKHTLS